MIIYKATNTKNGKVYIGQTIRGLKDRKAEHLRAAGNIKWFRNPSLLHLAISEHGSASFIWEVLEECRDCDHLNDRERFYIKLLNSFTPNGYNQTVGGHMSEEMSEEVRDRIAESMVAVHKNPDYQARVYPKLKGLAPPNKGVPMSEAQKAKVSAAKLAVYADPTYTNPNVGQKRTPEQLENLKKGRDKRALPTGDRWKESHGEQYTDEVRAKMRAAKVGKKPANTKQVECIETGEVYAGLSEASAATGANRQSIYLQIKGKLKKAGGFTFRYKNNV